MQMGVSLKCVCLALVLCPVVMMYSSDAAVDIHLQVPLAAGMPFKMLQELLGANQAQQPLEYGGRGVDCLLGTADVVFRSRVGSSGERRRGGTGHD